HLLEIKKGNILCAFGRLDQAMAEPASQPITRQTQQAAKLGGAEQAMNPGGTICHAETVEKVFFGKNANGSAPLKLLRGLKLVAQSEQFLEGGSAQIAALRAFHEADPAKQARLNPFTLEFTGNDRLWPQPRPQKLIHLFPHGHGKPAADFAHALELALVIGGE